MSKLKINIIDYGVGNTHSVANAIKYLDYRVTISDTEEKIRQADVLILPGVGAFDTAISNLKQRGLEDLLEEQVNQLGKPILGICVGMQMMATWSEENGKHNGLNWIPGKVVRLDLSQEYVVPHVGWNDIDILKKEKLFSRLDENTHFYFDHSYHLIPEAAEHIAAISNYGIKVTAAVQKDNICGVQFHPEKSQTNGLKLFRSFIQSLIPYA